MKSDYLECFRYARSSLNEMTFSKNLDGRQCHGFRDWSVIGQPNLQARIHPSMPDFYVIMLEFLSTIWYSRLCEPVEAKALVPFN